MCRPLYVYFDVPPLHIAMQYYLAAIYWFIDFLDSDDGCPQNL